MSCCEGLCTLQSPVPVLSPAVVIMVLQHNYYHHLCHDHLDHHHHLCHVKVDVSPGCKSKFAEQFLVLAGKGFSVFLKVIFIIFDHSSPMGTMACISFKSY